MKHRFQSIIVAAAAFFVVHINPALPSTCTQNLGAWKDSIKGETRFIPIELWAGVRWDGRRELAMPAVDAEYLHIDRPRARYRITGPNPWMHPVLDKTFLIYERINPEKEERLKFQRFTINKEGTGLGRVYDSRPDQGVNLYSGGLKFPLGHWRQGETKQFDFEQFHSKHPARSELIRIKKIDHAFDGSKHCLEFKWKKIRKSDGRISDHQTYTYCPCRSMVKAVDHKR